MSYTPKNVKERIIHRLQITQGHLNKVLAMAQGDSYCIDVIHQSQAVQRALKEVDNLVLENHLKGCVAKAIQSGNQETAVAEVMNVFKKTN